ncbi:YbhB/YbcL family Raf kinase inhibitor-like protein [bacterium]|nr:YbhB/YbcL family Raf kinase inhibitor-like protein [bacterium]
MLKYLAIAIIIIIAVSISKYIFSAINSKEKEKSSMPITITSPAFKNEGIVPEIYTGVNKDISPPLEWSGIPANAKSIAIICDDPDASTGNWNHWIIFDISPDTTKLEAGIPMAKLVLGNTKQGRTDFGSIGYSGPMPPPGNFHRYYFKIYALNTMLNAAPGIKRHEFLVLIKEHVLAEGSLMGRFKR